MLFLQKWRTFVQITLETDKITQAVFQICEWLIVAAEARYFSIYLRCHGVVQEDIHASLVDLVHHFLPHCDITEMPVEEGEVKRLDSAVSACNYGREGKRLGIH